MKKKVIDFIEVPHYDELSVKNLFNEFKSDKEFMKCIPDKYPDGKGPAREYFFNMLNTIYPDYL